MIYIYRSVVISIQNSNKKLRQKAQQRQTHYPQRHSALLIHPLSHRLSLAAARTTRRPNLVDFLQPTFVWWLHPNCLVIARDTLTIVKGKWRDFINEVKPVGVLHQKVLFLVLHETFLPTGTITTSISLKSTNLTKCWTQWRTIHHWLFGFISIWSISPCFSTQYDQEWLQSAAKCIKQLAIHYGVNE